MSCNHKVDRKAIITLMSGADVAEICLDCYKGGYEKSSFTDDYPPLYKFIQELAFIENQAQYRQNVERMQKSMMQNALAAAQNQQDLQNDWNSLASNTQAMLNIYAQQQNVANNQLNDPKTSKSFWSGLFFK